MEADKQVDELIKGIKKFMRLRKSDFDIEVNEDDNAVYYTIKPKEWVKVTGAEFDRFFDLLREFGFCLLNGAENKAMEYVGYKYIIGTEEFGRDDGTKILVDFSEEIVNGKERVYIKDITIKKEKVEG